MNSLLYSAVFLTFLLHHTNGKADWPAGQYGLPKPKTGCPDGWVEGRRFKSDANDQKRSNPNSHLAGAVNDQGIEQDFCMKTDSEGNGQWPSGRYCVLKRNNCPVGLTEGYIILNKRNTKDSKSKEHGKIDYCCSSSGNPSSAITLPVDKPFYLYSYENGKCQQVNGASAKEEAVMYSKTEPLQKKKQKLVFCYYTPVDTGSSKDKESGPSVVATAASNGNEGVGKELMNSVNTGSELDNKTQSSALAVAIGVGIAGALIGIASVALVSKRIMSKKGKVDEDQPRPDEP